MYPFIPPGEHHFTAKVSRFDNPQTSRTLTKKALTWKEARVYFNSQLEDNEYIWDCCDDTVCERPELEPEETPTPPPTEP